MGEMERLRKTRSSIASSVTRLLSKIDDELDKSQSDIDVLEELVEQIKLKEEHLIKIDGEVEEETKMDDLEEFGKVSRVLEYKEHITLKKTKIRRMFRKTQGDALSVSHV